MCRAIVEIWCAIFPPTDVHAARPIFTDALHVQNKSERGVKALSKIGQVIVYDCR